MNKEDFINVIKGKKNPQEVVLSVLGMNNSPVLKNAVEMAKNNDYDGVKQLAENICKEKGMDFDKEFNNFMNNFR